MQVVAALTFEAALWSVTKHGPESHEKPRPNTDSDLYTSSELLHEHEGRFSDK